MNAEPDIVAASGASQQTKLPSKVGKGVFKAGFT